MDKIIPKAMAAAAGRTAPMAESWMRSNAPWTDQTTNARSGLRATPRISSKQVAVVLSHSVPYGIWLEVRWGGRYAIIEPALREFAPRMMQMVAKLIVIGR